MLRFLSSNIINYTLSKKKIKSFGKTNINKSEDRDPARSTLSNSFEGTISMNIYSPFTYCITFKPTGQCYYGVRTRKNCHPGELWTTYFTSSKRVRRLIEEFGTSAFDFEIRQTFSNKADAIAWEHRVLTKLDVVNNTKWLNENVGGKQFVTRDTLTEEHKRNAANAQRGKKKKPCSEERKRKISEANKGTAPPNKGKKMSDEFRKKMSAVRKGSKASAETRAKISAGGMGRIHSSETREKMALKRKEYWDKKRALSGP